MSAEQRQSESPGTVRRLHEGDSILAHDPALAEIVRRLVAAYQPEWVYLFGSVARGEAGPDSDYDLLVVVQDTALPERCDSDLAYRVLRGTGIAADVVVWTRSRFERRRHVVTSLPATVLREGRLLHAA
jgi:predicted nucleotidyltransferase